MPLASSAALVTANKFIDLCLFCTGAHKCPVAVDQACTWKLYTKTVGTHLVLARSQTEVKRRCGEAPLKLVSFNSLFRMVQVRIGNGYDIHRLVAGRSLILGGVLIEHELGLLGHSDADVLTHAIMDAMLGALSLGDIGHYFPPTDDLWKGADSIKLLKQVNGLIQERGWQVNNIDSVIVAERPKLKPHIGAMRDRLSGALNLNPDQVGVKATTNERLGPEGREEGISAYTVVLLMPLIL